MPQAAAYLVQNEDTMQFATVIAFSLRGAAVKYAAEYRPAKGTQFRLKERGGSSGWTYFSKTSTGVRQL